MRPVSARTVLRCAIGLVLLATAAGKLADLRGFEDVLATYRVLSPPARGWIAVAVPSVELVVAGCLLSGRALRPAASASAALHAIYATWSAGNLLRGVRVSNCGCFGVFFPRPLTWWTVAEDVLLAALSGLLWWRAEPGGSSA